MEITFPAIEIWGPLSVRTIKIYEKYLNIVLIKKVPDANKDGSW